MVLKEDRNKERKRGRKKDRDWQEFLMLVCEVYPGTDGLKGCDGAGREPMEG